MKQITCLFVAVAVLFGCSPEDPSQAVKNVDPRLSDVTTDFSSDLTTIAEPVELPEGTVDPELVGAWLATYSLDQEKYDPEPSENKLIIDDLVSGLNSSQNTIELIADGTFVQHSSFPTIEGSLTNDFAGNIHGKGVWNISDGKLIIVIRETASSKPGEELPDTTPLTVAAAENALQEYTVGDDRNSFSQGPVGREELGYMPVIGVFHRVE